MSLEERQPGNEICSVNRRQHEKYFSLKSHTQNVVEKLVADPFLKTKTEHTSGSTV